MASQKTKFKVGLFMASGISIALISFIWLGMSRFLEKGRNYVTYFNESVQGLQRDSPVKYRGVSIGRVERIEVAPDSKLIQVVLKIDSGHTLEKDTVAQLKAVGITGSMFVELDRKKGRSLTEHLRLHSPLNIRLLPQNHQILVSFFRESMMCSCRSRRSILAESPLKPRLLWII